ncbi:hypothetical protein GCM10010140_18200 [Streptosporangium pseudovulgare]|uniref:PE-PGRS family protein n=2 Tax=Streptosporangium pseudovulgare TaxID=35765 RepID=A0ABQ2QNA8_9ACTN|nr:hypothetical protein GCM10010140_18200 [Streptosporangium pseudovulgare]
MFASLLAVPAVASDGLGGLPPQAGPFSAASSQVKTAKPCSEAKHPAKCRARRGGHGGGGGGGGGTPKSGPGINPGRIGDGGEINPGGGGGEPAGING